MSLISPSSRPASLVSIAAAAKVSTSTVSRALRNHPSISESTRERVRRIANEMAYAPNPLLTRVFSELREHRTSGYRGTIAWLETIPETDHTRADPIFKSFFHGAKEHAKAIGFNLERFPVHGTGLTPMRLAGMLSARGIEGVVILPDYHEISTTRYFQHFPFDQFSVASIGTQLAYAHIGAAMNDQYMSARMAHERLRALGYRRVGLICWRFQVDLLSGRFVGGFRSLPSQEAAPVLLLDQQQSPMPSVAYGTEIPAMRPVVAFVRKHRLDAIVTSIYSVYYVSLLPYLRREFGELAFATLDRRGEESLAGIEQYHERVSAAAVESVVAKTVLLEGEWHDGPSAPGRAEGARTQS
jgi:DNA-binding LacI/PurR family transcriptional regulator